MVEFDLCGIPWEHQRAALDKATGQPHFALFFEPGTGKSYTAILIARMHMWRAQAAKRVLVLAPPVVLSNWKNEWIAHSHIKADEISVLTGRSKTRIEAVACNPRIVITNYEALRIKDLFSVVADWSPQIVICDESHRLKNHQAKCTRQTIELAKNSELRLLLSGTPVLNSALDLWSQFYVLDRGKALGINYYAFRKRYFYDVFAGRPYPRGEKWMPRKGALSHISERIANCSMHVAKEDCLDLPPLVKKRIDVPLTQPQQKAYWQLAEELIAYIDDKACATQTAMTKSLRLIQLVSGFLPMEGCTDAEKSIHNFEINNRNIALTEILRDLTPASKVIVWAVFKENYKTIRRICEELGVVAVELHGEVPTAEKHAAVDRFNTDETVRVLIGHPGSGGIGVNLVAADTMVYFSRSWSLEHDIQAEARNYRGGSERHKKITRYDLVAPNTIDELVLARLQSKMDIGAEIVQDIRSTLINALPPRARLACHDAAIARGRGKDASEASYGD